MTRFRPTTPILLCGLLVLAVLVRGAPVWRTASTIFVAVCVQAMPFLVLGVVVSGAMAAWVPTGLLRKALPRNTFAAVGVAGLAGAALPGCECASVPVARRLLRQGVPTPAALAFLVAAPAINPVVLVATAVAFPTRPAMVLARFLASLLTAVAAGCLLRRTRIPAVAVPSGHDHGGAWPVFLETARTDLAEAGGFLVIGALAAAALNVLIPHTWFTTLGDNAAVGVPIMALLAVVLALCSEADAFVAASFSTMPLLPRLVFLVVGPAVDVKLIALQAGTFGRSFVLRYAPTVFVTATLSAVLVGLCVLGGTSGAP